MSLFEPIVHSYDILMDKEVFDHDEIRELEKHYWTDLLGIGPHFRVYFERDRDATSFSFGDRPVRVVGKFVVDLTFDSKHEAYAFRYKTLHSYRFRGRLNYMVNPRVKKDECPLPDVIVHAVVTANPDLASQLGETPYVQRIDDKRGYLLFNDMTGFSLFWGDDDRPSERPDAS